MAAVHQLVRDNKEVALLLLIFSTLDTMPPPLVSFDSTVTIGQLVRSQSAGALVHFPGNSVPVSSMSLPDMRFPGFSLSSSFTSLLGSPSPSLSFLHNITPSPSPTPSQSFKSSSFPASESPLPPCKSAPHMYPSLSGPTLPVRHASPNLSMSFSAPNVSHRFRERTIGYSRSNLVLRRPPSTSDDLSSSAGLNTESPRIRGRQLSPLFTPDPDDYAPSDRASPSLLNMPSLEPSTSTPQAHLEQSFAPSQSPQPPEAQFSSPLSSPPSLSKPQLDPFRNTFSNEAVQLEVSVYTRKLRSASLSVPTSTRATRAQRRMASTVIPGALSALGLALPLPAKRQPADAEVEQLPMIKKPKGGRGKKRVASERVSQTTLGSSLRSGRKRAVSTSAKSINKENEDDVS